METLVKAPTKKDSILTALSLVPIATTQQIAKLFQSNNSPLKKASQNLVELENQKLVEWEWHRRSKIWTLTKKGRAMTESTMMKYEHTDHTLAVAEIYFTLNPQHFMFEPKEKFEYGGKRLTWNPDCIFVHEKKVYVCEVQRKSLGTREWRSKWEAFNLYFESAFKEAAYQDWSDKGKAILPRFIAITDNKFAAEGFDIKQRELIVMESIEQLIEK